MVSVQIYIKKNTLITSGQVTDPNTTPFLTFKDGTKSFVTNEFKGYYVKIVSGTGANSVAWIDSNTSVIITLQTPIQVDASSQYEIYKSEFERLDLFNDEKINVNSSVSNANDIGKIFTDYSQSFTIPASPKNNKILSHWYESNLDNGYDHRVRYDGYIKLDSVLFRNGNIQLEKVNKKNGFIENYSITFYGNLTQLKDRFKDDKLNILDYTTLDHIYDSTNVINRIQNATMYPVSYPLIGSKKKYSYKFGPIIDDITFPAGAIAWDELFPAIQLSKIFQFIQSKYNVIFTVSFFNLDQWTKLYLYLKNAEKLLVFTQPLKLFPTYISDSSFYNTNGTITSNWNWFGLGPSKFLEFYVKITPTDLTRKYNIFIYKDGVLFSSFSDLTGVTSNSLNSYGLRFDFIDQPSNPNQYVYEVFITSEGVNTFNTEFTIIKVSPSNFGPGEVLVPASNLTGQTTISKIPIANYVPDITINDFITGIIKAFNLMIVPINENTFEFIPLESYYMSGKTLDITQYVYSDEMVVDRPKLFKSINFQFEKSNNILNNAYRSLYNSEYGDLIFTNSNSNESSSYNIKLPFENILFEKTVGYNFQTATLIDKDLKQYTPKPMLIYNNGRLTNDFPIGDKIYVTTETTPVAIDNYFRFSNEYNSIPTDPSYSGLMTMNFNNEQSSWYNVLAPLGLYFRNYKNYIDNLYNIKTRILKVKALFPASLLSSSVKNGFGRNLGIALNDRLIIRNKRYIINNMSTDLTSGEVNLELLTDYRGPNAATTIGYKFADYRSVRTDKEAFDLNINIYLNDYDSFQVKGATNFLSYPISGMDEYSDILIPVTIPYNGGGVDRFDQIGIEYYNDGILQTTENIIFIQTG